MKATRRVLRREAFASASERLSGARFAPPPLIIGNPVHNQQSRLERLFGNAPEPEIVRYSGAVRLALIVGGAAALWGLGAVVVMLLLRK